MASQRTPRRPGRRRHVAMVRSGLRSMRSGLSTFTRQVGVQLSLRDVDLECLDLINLHGPLSPSHLARLANLHPATLTGILDRLERGQWISRQPSGADRRSVVVNPLRTRNPEMYRLLAPMNQALEQICADYTENELELLANFLRSVADASHSAAAQVIR